MGVFEMVVLVVAIGVFGGVTREALKNKQSASTSQLNEINSRLSKLENLEQRIQTLEAIVTNEKETLKREIDALQ